MWELPSVICVFDCSVLTWCLSSKFSQQVTPKQKFRHVIAACSQDWPTGRRSNVKASIGKRENQKASNRQYSYLIHSCSCASLTNQTWRTPNFVKCSIRKRCYTSGKHSAWKSKEHLCRLQMPFAAKSVVYQTQSMSISLPEPTPNATRYPYLLVLQPQSNRKRCINKGKSCLSHASLTWTRKLLDY